MRRLTLLLAAVAAGLGLGQSSAQGADQSPIVVSESSPRVVRSFGSLGPVPNIVGTVDHVTPTQCRALPGCDVVPISFTKWTHTVTCNAEQPCLIGQTPVTGALTVLATPVGWADLDLYLWPAGETAITGTALRSGTSSSTSSEGISVPDAESSEFELVVVGFTPLNRGYSLDVEYRPRTVVVIA